MQKSYLIDTNVLLYDPDSFQQFQDNQVIIPLGVIRELDKFKREMNEVGRNARTAIRLIDALRLKGNLSEGIKTDDGGIIRVVRNGSDDSHHVDMEILEIAKKLNSPGLPCIVVTKDINLRIQCDVIGIAAEDYETGLVDIFNEIYTGYQKIDVAGDQIDVFRHKGQIPLPVLPDGNFSANQYIHMTNPEGDKAIGRVNSDCNLIIPLIRSPREMGAVQPKNMEQNFFMDALLDDNIHLVTVAGKAGSGKTLLSVAAGFYLTVECHRYMKLLVSRPVFPLGKDLGFLPGTIDEKISPWMRPIVDAFDFIADHQPSKRAKPSRGKEKSDEPRKTDGKKLMEDSGKVEVEPLVYIRGRSIHRQFLIVDECQNLTPLEIKTIVTRAGPGTKVVLTGDIYQIDSPFLDTMSNGLSYVIGRMRGQKLYAHISLEKGVRSPLSDLAASLL